MDMARYVIVLFVWWGLFVADGSTGYAQSRPANRQDPGAPATTSKNRTAESTAPSAAQQSPQLIAVPMRTAGRQPPGFPLSPEKQKRIDDILAYWEKQTITIKTFQCEYRREEYDPVMGPAKRPATVAIGTIKFAAPDKGLMEDTKVYGYALPEKEGDKEYRLLEGTFSQYWLCDGTSLFRKDFRNLTLVETQLPPELRGKAIAEGPLPFVFGAKADAMRRRFWIREVTPENNPDGEYFLEMIPKLRDDAANYAKITVILDRKSKGQLLPRAMKVTKLIETVERGEQDLLIERHDDYFFAVDKRRINDPADRVKEFLQAFVKPTVPRDWKKETQDWNMNPIHPPVATRGTNQVLRPGTQSKKR
jgi:TIGR03009 family protein